MAEPGLDHALAAGDESVPLALWQRHHDLAVGELVEISPDAAARWSKSAVATGAPPVEAVLLGGGFVLADDDSAPPPRTWVRARTLADTVGAEMSILMVGLNPSVYAADMGVGFGRPGNRYWPAALRAGIVSADRDPLHALIRHGVGMTDLVKRATARADELDRSEYVAGGVRLAQLVSWLQPGIVCVVGLTGWRAAVDRRAVTGLQPEPLGTRPVYVMPNPSGLNAHVTVDGLADHFREVQALANRAG